MNIYCELKKNRIRIKINAEEIEIKVRSDFYSKIKGTASYHMFLDTISNDKIKDFVTRHRKNLGLYNTFRYIFLRNRALVIVDRDVQELMTVRLVHAYATLSLDARVVYVIRKPNNFTDDKLETIESIKETYLNNGQINEDAPISKLR
jgi:hypothetical protein